MIEEYDTYPQKTVDNFTYKLTEKEFSTNPYLKIITYVEKDKIIGFLLYSLIYDRIEIEQFEIEKEERGKGIGDKLLKYLIEKYKNHPEFLENALNSDEKTKKRAKLLVEQDLYNLKD